MASKQGKTVMGAVRWMVAAAAMLVASTGVAQAHYGQWDNRHHYYRDNYGYWDDHDNYRHYGYWHHHHGYWDNRGPFRVFINVD